MPNWCAASHPDRANAPNYALARRLMAEISAANNLPDDANHLMAEAQASVNRTRPR